MNALMKPNDMPLTMTSREIAELTGKEHAHVMRDIRVMMEALSTNPDLLSCAKSITYEGKDGRQYPQYEMDKDTCLTLLLGYDAVARMKVVKRWQELEYQATQGFSIPQNMPEALRLAAEAMEQRDRLALESKAQAEALSDAAPKVDVYDRIVLADGDMSITVAAKSLGIDPIKRLFQWMHENNWIYKRIGSDRWLAHQDKIRAGYLDHRHHSVRQPDGSDKLYPNVVVMPKGLAYLAEKVSLELSIPSRREPRKGARVEAGVMA